MTNQPAEQAPKASVAHHINRLALMCWTTVSLVYFLLAAYLGWFSADKDLPQAAVWFSLGVCFFCIGLIPLPVSESKAADTYPESGRGPGAKD